MNTLQWLAVWLVAVVAATSVTTLAEVRAQTANPTEGAATLPMGVARVQSVEGITEYRLANGLKVLLAPDLADDRVSVNLTYMVGSRHEGYGETGMAHLLEHLVFKGTPSTADPKAEFGKRGFTFNGTTTADRTNYFATFTSNQDAMDWYVGWQADAMVNSFIAKKDLDSEMTVVRSEFELAENNPFQALGQRINSAAYQWHAYGKATIGAKSDIENIDISRLQAFYKRHYRPDNAVLIVAGKFDVARTLGSIQMSLGALARPASPLPVTYTLDPVQDGERSVVVRRPAPAQAIFVSYHTPPALHPVSAALQVLASALGDVPSGRLHKALVESKLAQGVFALASAQREAGGIGFGTVFGPADEGAPRQQLLLDTVESLARDPIRPDEFERAKAKLNKGMELAFANAAAVANGAMAAEVLGDWRAIFVGRERMKAVTLDDVQRVARSYLIPDNRTLGHLIPTKDPVRAPPPRLPDVAAYLRGFQFNEQGMESVAFDYSPSSLYAKVAFAPTASGLKTATLHKPVRGELVTLNIVLRFGTVESLRNQIAAAAMANQMLRSGTPRMTRQQIQDEMVKLGAALKLNFNESGGSIDLTTRKESFKQALELTLHLLKESSFPEPEFEEARSAWVKGIEGQVLDKSAQADSAWGRYGNPYTKGDPRYRYTLEEWLRELKTVTRTQAYDFYRRYYGAQDALVTLLGPVDMKEYRQVVAAGLDGWRTAQPWQRIERPLVEAAPARLVFDTPDKTNVSLRATHGMAVSALGMEGDYFGLQLASRIFGGGPGSRLWVRLRETSGLSYSAGAGFRASLYERSGGIHLSTEVAPQNVTAAETALREELARSLSEGFTPAEVARFKGQYLAERLRGRSGDAWAMGFMAGQMEFDHPKDAHARNDALIDSLTAEQVNATWRKYLRPEKLVWGVFGDQAKIK